MKNIWVVLLTIFLPSTAFSQEEFDFVVIGSACKMIVSYNVVSDESLKVTDADTPILFCNRNSKIITCNVTHAEELDKQEKRVYKLEMDSPPILFFQTDNGSDSAYINIRNNTGSYSSRILGKQFMGQKVCSSLFLTYNQYNLMMKKQLGAESN